MHKPLYAVIDTNVVVSALLKPDSVPGQVFMRALTGEITPVLSIGIREEYVEVLARKKFKFDQELVGRVLAAFEEKAVYRSPAHNPDALALAPTQRTLRSMPSRSVQERNGKPASSRATPSISPKPHS